MTMSGLRRLAASFFNAAALALAIAPLAAMGQSNPPQNTTDPGLTASNAGAKPIAIPEAFKKFDNYDLHAALLEAANRAKNSTDSSSRRHILRELGEEVGKEIIYYVEVYQDIHKHRTDHKTPIQQDPKVAAYIRGMRKSDPLRALTTMNFISVFSHSINMNFEFGEAVKARNGITDFQVACAALGESFVNSGNTLAQIKGWISDDMSRVGADGLTRAYISDLYSRVQKSRNFPRILDFYFPGETGQSSAPPKTALRGQALNQ